MTTKESHKHWELCDQIIAVYFKVYNEIGYGFQEDIYHQAMTIGLSEAGLRVENQKELILWFRERKLAKFRVDALVENKVVLEYKAKPEIVSANAMQLTSYLKSSLYEVGLLFNFGPEPRFKRLVQSNSNKKPPYNGVLTT